MGSELTGARDLSRLSVLEENSWEKQEKGDLGQFFWGDFFSIGKRGRSREKGEKKQSLAPGSLPAIPKIFWSHPLGIARKIPGRKILQDSQAGWDQSGADPSAEFPGFSRFSSSLGFLIPAQKDQDGSSSEFLGFLTFSITKPTFCSFPEFQFLPNFSTSNESHGNDPENSQNPNF